MKAHPTSYVRQARAFAYTFGDSAPTADLASGGFSRHIAMTGDVIPVVERSGTAGKELPTAWKWSPTTKIAL
jgi:hypothetical protein